MPSIYGAMNTAVTGLMTSQLALEVTGQNISNVNNPDYTRQQANLSSDSPIAYGNVMVGTGVRVTSITRSYDQFLEGQRISNSADAGYWDAKNDIGARVQTVFNESSEAGLNNQLNQFFQAWQDLSTNPQGITERTQVISQGTNLATMFNKVSQDLRTVRTDLDTKVTSSLSQINQITGQIADMNKAIHESESFNVSANDFRDKRDALVRQLSGYVQVKSVEDPNTHEVTVALNSGRPLVVGQTAFQLSNRVRPDDTGTSEIYWKDTDGTYSNVTKEMQNGNMGAWIDMRDNQVNNYLDQVDRLSATMVRDLNNIHSSGYGLDGGTGRNFFSSLTPIVNPGSTNVGSGIITFSGIADAQNINLDKFRIDFTGPNSFNVTDVTLGKQVAANQSYTPGSDISYFLNQGMHVSISKPVATGDTFEVNASKNAASLMSVDAAIRNDTLKIAAGKTTNQGDGDNALSLARSQNTMNMNKAAGAASGTATFAEYYNSIVGQVGVSAQASLNMFNQQETINNQVDNRREQVAGVSLDEEMVNLIKYQHAYQASARMITVVDSMLQTLIGMGT